MTLPDGSHDRLSPSESFVIEQTLRNQGLWTPAEVRKEASVIRLLFASFVVAMAVVIGGLTFLWLDMRHEQAIREHRPLPTFVTPVTPQVTPFPSGWEPS